MSLIVNTNINTEKIFNYDKDTKLKYKDIDYETVMLLFRNRSVNGEFKDESSISFALDCMEEMIHDWSGVIDSKTKKAIKFKKEYIRGLSPKGINAFFVKILMPLLIEWGVIEPDETSKKKGLSAELKN